MVLTLGTASGLQSLTAGESARGNGPLPKNPLPRALHDHGLHRVGWRLGVDLLSGSR